MPRSRPSRKSWASNPFRPVGRRALRGSPFEIERPRESRAPGAVCVFAGQGVWCRLPVCVCAPGAVCVFVGAGGRYRLPVCVCAPGAVWSGGSGAVSLFACVLPGPFGQGDLVPLACLRVCSRGRLCVCGGRCLTPRESGGSSPPVSPPAGSRQRPLPPACGSTPAARRGSPAR